MEGWKGEPPLDGLVNCPGCILPSVDGGTGSSNLHDGWMDRRADEERLFFLSYGGALDISDL